MSTRPVQETFKKYLDTNTLRHYFKKKYLDKDTSQNSIYLVTDTIKIFPEKSIQILFIVSRYRYLNRSGVY